MVYLGTSVSRQLKKGEISFPVPPTKKRCTQNRIPRPNCHWQTICNEDANMVKKELKRGGCLKDIEAHHDDLRARSEEAVSALYGAKIVLAKTEKHVTPLVTQILETRELLKELEEKLNQRNKEIDALQDQCDKLEKSYEAAKTEEQNAAKQVEEHRKIVQPIKIRRDEAMAGIDRTKVLLSSM